MKKILLAIGLLVAFTMTSCKKIKSKTFKASVTQQSDSLAPVFEVFENTIGDIEWTREAPGIYKGNSNMSFKGGRYIHCSSPSNPGNTFTGAFHDDNQVQLYTTMNGNFSDNVLTNTVLEITVYED